LKKDFNRVSSGHQFDDFKSLSNQSNGEAFFTGISSVEHKAINKSFNDRALGFQEFSLLISSGSVGNHNLDFSLDNSDVIFEASIINL
jgi:hypothetical protein